LSSSAQHDADSYVSQLKIDSQKEEGKIKIKVMKKRQKRKYQRKKKRKNLPGAISTLMPKKKLILFGKIWNFVGVQSDIKQ
jgi:hypothetical protein